MRILLLGFGRVGRAVASLLLSGSHLDACIVGIITRHHGSIVNSSGVPLDRAIATYDRRGEFDQSTPGWSALESQTAVDRLDYDVLVELTTLSIERRGEPAASHVRGALRRKKHVVLANKGPIAFAYHELRALASESRCQLLFESTVMDGAPVFSLARSSLLGCKVTAVSGVLNSTTNFVLSEMEKGRTMSEAVESAQREGFAEADPRYDLEGWDAAVKVCVVWNVLGNGRLTPHGVTRSGIEGTRPEDVAEALTRSRRLKLVARVRRHAERDHATVALEELPLDDPFAGLSGTGSALRIETDCMSPIVITQMSPTLKDTAYGVLNDLLTIASHGETSSPLPR